MSKTKDHQASLRLTESEYYTFVVKFNADVIVI